ncbi:AAT family amino acid transporter [Pseudovirgaria hyperparasitica]|uniref:AAT family amino acid transporter n=1 Tax=Pseudovirgaria hyperparasitica TaxID=470096 RepID=A0A6A6WLS7_9PEZI|nr:AAT family amino acid transporter [Pseudovirgaria hyperparasitica]KAF2763170.1 AAT family amino acid transporter [Pseudovirgaria hyperparasitica]
MSKDIEKTSAEIAPSPTYEYGSSDEPKGTAWGNFRDSFKRQPGVSTADGPEDPAQLSRRLKGRHLQMIAIGGSIGTGLFIGSGSALAKGGPASLVLAFGLIGIMLYCTVHALGEMAVMYPVSGSFATFSSRFIDPAWGFAMGWNYAMQWLIVLPLEIIAAAITLTYWEGARDVNSAAWSTIFFVLIVAINLFGVKGYGEAEFVFSLIKVIAVIGFIILGICINVGASPTGEVIGDKYWSDPGAFNNGFKGLCSVFVTAAFAFAGTELVGLAAAETQNPRRMLPTAIKQVFWRITLFYIVSLVIVGCLVPYTEPELLNGSSSVDITASPFVIAISNASIPVLPSIFNVVIMIAVLSVGNSSIYGSSRVLAGMAERGQAPKILAYIDRSGRPLVSILVASAFGLLYLIVAAGDQARSDAFNWMLALSGLSSIFTWGSICLAHIRFRSAWKKQGHSLDELAFRSQPGVIGSWVGFIFNCLVLIAQFWTGFAPVGYGELTANERVISFFQAYLSAPIIVVTYVVYKIIYKTPIMRSHTIDLQTGRRELDLQHLIEEEQAEKRAWPMWKKVYKFFC